MEKYELKKYVGRAQTAIIVDFLTNTMNLYTFEESVFASQTKEAQSEKEEKCLKDKPVLTKSFKILNNFKTIEIDEICYEIPPFFNREKVIEKDKKTWQMIFYNIFFEETKNAIKDFEITNILKEGKQKIQKTKKDN